MRSLTISSIILLIGLNASSQSKGKDTSQVIKLNHMAYNFRLTDPEKTIRYSTVALKLAKELYYDDGIGESFRMIGIGEFYRNNSDKSIENLLISHTFFLKSGNKEGQANVFNNIGNLYREIDYNKALEYFERSLKIAYQLNLKPLIAGLYLNMGTVFQKKQNFEEAINMYEKSRCLFASLNNSTGLTLCQQNLSAVYANIGDFKKAEENALAAIRTAKEYHQYFIIAGTNLTLTSVYLAQDNYWLAEEALTEVKKYSKLIKDQRLQYDYLVASYRLEHKRKNYKKALDYLAEAYKQDSITYKSIISDKITLLEFQYNQLQKQRENELTIERQKNTKILLWASCAIAALAFFVILLLIKNVKKSAKTNEELTRLNEEVSRQKDDLDRTNQNLEGIIEDRTKDLQIKNKKLSEYSSHLSHQIRSPVATLKGLMLLEDDKLIDKDELIEQMAKCINDLDDKIVNINENLNNPTKSSLIADE